MEGEVIIRPEIQDDVDKFIRAIEIEDYEVMDKLISEGKIDLNKCYTESITSGIMCMACFACKFDKKEVFKYLIRKGTNPNLYNAQSILGYVLITSSIKEDFRTSAIKFLLKNGADPNFEPPKSYRPLVYSISYCRLEGAELLLRYGADPNFTRKVCNLASRTDQIKMRFPTVKLLLEYNADPGDKSFLENIRDPEERKELEGLCYSKRKGLRSLPLEK